MSEFDKSSNHGRRFTIIHFHMLFLEGVNIQTRGRTKFERVKAPRHSDMERVINTVSHRIAKYLEKAGLIQRDIDNTFLNLPVDDEDSWPQLQASSVNYRIAVGEDAGKKYSVYKHCQPKITITMDN